MRREDEKEGWGGRMRQKGEVSYFFWGTRRHCPCPDKPRSARPALSLRLPPLPCRRRPGSSLQAGHRLHPVPLDPAHHTSVTQ